MRKLIVLFLLLQVFLRQSSLAADGEKEFSSISIMATTSLTEVMTEILRGYSARKNYTVSAIYDSPGELLRRIKEGENADIFISEQPFWINNLKQTGVIDVYSISQIAGNRLDVVAPVDGKTPGNIKMPLRDLLLSLGRRILLVGDYNNDPLGAYTKETLVKLGIWEKMQPMLAVSANSVNATYMISKGSSAGIIYHSDAFHNPEVKILAEIPEDLHEPIIYNAAVVASENMTMARDFIAYIKTPEVKKIFEKYGFITF